jgi:uncharacterized protein (TIGR03663 family)
MSAWEHTQGDRPGMVTVERAAYVLLALVAVGLRWTQLGLQPLSDGEAAQALAAYRFLHGTQAAAPEGSVPALFTANMVGFTLVGTSDAAARWLPALAGLALVLLPWGLRSRLGRGGALAASALLAISPAAVYHSRLLDGSIVVAACGLALVVGLARFAETQRPGGLYLAAGALGLGLCAGPGMITLLVLLLLFALVPVGVGMVRGRGQGWPGLHGAWEALSGERGWALTAGAVLAAAFGLTATALVLQPGNAGLAADLLGQWVQGFAPEAAGRPFYYPLLLLLRYEPLALILGLVEAGTVLVRGRKAATAAGLPLEALLIYWALAAGLLVVVAGHRPAGNVLLVSVPLALLAGRGIERAWRWARHHARLPEIALLAGLMLVLAVFGYLQLSAFSLSGVQAITIAGRALPMSTGYLLLALLTLALLVAVAAAASTWRGSGVVVAGVWLALVVGLGLWGVKSAWGVSHLHAGDPRELMIGQTTAPDVRTLVKQVEQLSLNRAGDAHTLPIAVDGGLGPAMEWALRDLEKQEALQLPSSPPTTKVVLAETQTGMAIGEEYQGEVFPLQISWQPSGLSGQALVRWLLFGKGGEPVRDKEVTLWVRVGD